jgi:hypothetical protein
MALSTIQKIDRLSADSDLMHRVVHGGVGETVTTEGGDIPTAADAVSTLRAYNLRGAWQAGMTLSLKDVVTYNGIAYAVLNPASYVSNSIADDLANGYISVHQGATREELAAQTGSALIGFTQQGSGAVSRTALSKMRDLPHVYDWGAKGDGNNDDTASINRAIAELMGTNVRELVLGWNHVVSDINLTNLFYGGLILRGQNTSQQPGPTAGTPAHGTIVVSGAASQGIDISGTSGLVLRDLTIVGDPNSPPRSGLYAMRTTVSAESFEHVFENVRLFGNFTKAGIYNFAGERWVIDKGDFRNYQDGGVTLYFTSVNSLGLLSKFAAPSTAVTPLTITDIKNASIYAMGAGNIGILIEQDPGAPVDATVENVIIDDNYFVSRNGAAASVKLSEVFGNVTYCRNTDESYATGDPSAASTLILHTGNRALNGLTIKENVFFAKQYVLQAATVQNYQAEGNFPWIAQTWQFNKLFNASHKRLSDNEKFVVTTQAVMVNVEPMDATAALNVTLPANSINHGWTTAYPGDPTGRITAEMPGDLVFDKFHAVMYMAMAPGRYSWNMVPAWITQSAMPTTGNWLAGMMVKLPTPGIAPGGQTHWLCVKAGTATPFPGGITGTTTAGSPNVTVNTAVGLAIGNYVNITGVDGTFQILSIAGNVLTMATNIPTAVAAAPLSFQGALFRAFP